MDLAPLVDRLRRNAAAFEALLGDLDDDLARWSPAPGRWSPLLVVNHLADEEEADFKVRLDHVLHRPGEAWPGIDPEGWVVAHDYAGRDPDASLHRFLAERERSVEWLEGLDPPDWDRAYEHPALGTLTAGDLMAAWVDHDHLHMRQVLGILHAWVRDHAAPHTTDYAGAW